MTRRLAHLALLTLLLWACGGDAGQPTATLPETTTTMPETTTTSRPATTTSSDTTTSSEATTTTLEEPLDPVGEPQTATLVTDGFPGTGDTAFLTDVRIGRHQGFERVVFEFDGAVPEYRLEYVQGPVTESPSGNQIEVSGDAYLSVTMAPATGVDLSGEAPEEIYEGPDRLASADTLAIEEVVQTEDFENVMAWVVGLDATLPFGAELVEDPPRLIIDIRTK